MDRAEEGSREGELGERQRHTEFKWPFGNALFPTLAFSLKVATRIDATPQSANCCMMGFRFLEDEKLLPANYHEDFVARLQT